MPFPVRSFATIAARNCNEADRTRPLDLLSSAYHPLGKAFSLKAIVVTPGSGTGPHLIEVPKPEVSIVPGGRGVLVRVLAVGLDGTDKEILAGEYGVAPVGDSYLITGHESFGIVESIGASVSEFSVGDLVVATVRRPGTSFYDAIGMPDFTTDETYYERGISRRHGFLTEYYVEEPENLVSVPFSLQDAAVLLEPASIVEKGLTQAYDVQRRLRIWRPTTAFVLGAGTIGLLATMALRLRNLDVHTFGIAQEPNAAQERVTRLGAHYHSTHEVPFLTLASSIETRPNIIFEATGYSPLIFDAMQVLAKNGVLVLSSVTGGTRIAEVPADRVNLDFVLGNKAMVGTVNANREHFESGVRDFAAAESTWPQWLSSLLTHRVEGLGRYRELVTILTSGTGVIKAYCQVSGLQ